MQPRLNQQRKLHIRAAVTLIALAGGCTVQAASAGVVCVVVEVGLCQSCTCLLQELVLALHHARLVDVKPSHIDRHLQAPWLAVLKPAAQQMDRAGQHGQCKRCCTVANWGLDCMHQSSCIVLTKAPAGHTATTCASTWHGSKCISIPRHTVVQYNTTAPSKHQLDTYHAAPNVDDLHALVPSSM